MQRYCLTRDERSNNMVTYWEISYLIDTATSRGTAEQIPHIYLAWEDWASSLLWNVSPCKYVETAQTKRWDIYYHEPTQVKILCLPHSVGIRAQTAAKKHAHSNSPVSGIKASLKVPYAVFFLITNLRSHSEHFGHCCWNLFCEKRIK